MTHWRAPELQEDTGRQPSVEPSSALRRRKLWFFRVSTYALPSLLGVALIVGTLMHQERLVFDVQTGSIKLQTPPLYVQEPGNEVTGHRYLFDSVLGWRNIPGWKATTRGYPLTINSKGLRGPECSYEKPSGTHRILVLGDSFTWGYGVGDDDVFPRVLANRLQDAPHPWEVLNAGVSGWGTDQEYLYLVNEGFKYSPDIVVVAFLVFNDPENNSSTVQYGLSKPAFLDAELELTGVPVPTPGGQLEQVTTAADPFDITFAIILRMAAACAEQRCRLVLMKFGMFLNPETHRDWDPRLAAALTAHPDIAYLDLDRAFAVQSLSKEALTAGNGNGHWNAIGHRVTATVLDRFLTDAGLLQTRRR